MENYSALTPLHKKFDVILSKTFFTVKSYSVFIAVLTLQNGHNFFCHYRVSTLKTIVELFSPINIQCKLEILIKGKIQIQ